MAKKVLFIDDIVERFDRFQAYFPEKDCCFARTMDEAANLLMLQTWDEIWLDHDNGDPLNTWRPICYLIYIAEHTKHLKVLNPGGKVFLHSANDSGRNYMESYLKTAGITVVNEGFPYWIFSHD